MEGQITEMDMVIRLGVSFLAGAIIGIERASRRQVAGLRTHILISTGATLLMLLSIWLPQEFNPGRTGDPGRIAAQVVSGIGFLGAGAIIRLGNNIRGLTTAASLWLMAAVGLAIGAGMYLAAGVTELIALSSLIILGIIEKRLFPSQRTKLLEITYKEGSPDTKETRRILEDFGIQVQSMDLDQSSGKTKVTRLRLLVGLPDAVDIPKLIKALKTNGKANRIEVKEKY
jgi:putative Mg2+ transporter-C (MgtC) family protein